jgi:hypothetical protein
MERVRLRPAFNSWYSRRENTLPVSSIPRPLRSTCPCTRSSLRSAAVSTDSEARWLRRTSARLVGGEFTEGKRLGKTSHPHLYPDTVGDPPLASAVSAPVPANSVSRNSRGEEYSLRAAWAGSGRERRHRSRPPSPQFELVRQNID